MSARILSWRTKLLTLKFQHVRGDIIGLLDHKYDKQVIARLWAYEWMNEWTNERTNEEEEDIYLTQKHDNHGN